MRHHLTTIIVLLLSLIPMAPPSSSASAAAAPTIHAEDAALGELAEWALGRYEDAGLTLPSIAIHLHRGGDICQGNRGIFNAGLERVDVCVDDPMVALHEIAHAWTHENLSPTRRAEYVAAGGFDSWDDADTSWLDKGSENAADTIAWALLERPIKMLTPDGPIAQTNEAYRLLTGSDTPRLVFGA